MAELVALSFLSGAFAPVLSAQSAKPDQVYAANRRTGAVSPVSGVVEENGLEKVVVLQGEKSKDLNSELVVRIVFGDVPPSFKDAGTYFERGDFASSAEQYRLAAGDASARDVVKAAARLRAAEALMRSGAADPSAFARAGEEVATFLADYPTNREVPAARSLQARAAWLAGDAAGAAEMYRLILREAENEEPTTGYSWSRCMAAGLAGAQAYAEAGDADQARELYGKLDSGLARVLGPLEEDDAQRPELLAIQARARLGEGWVLLAKGTSGPAKTFFRGQLSSAGQASAAMKYGAQLGLAEALLAEGEVREAQLLFAEVAALDYVDRDRSARALVGMARCSMKLSDGDSRTNARRSLQTVIDQYGDTPAARAARDELAKL